MGAGGEEDRRGQRHQAERGGAEEVAAGGEERLGGAAADQGVGAPGRAGGRHQRRLDQITAAERGRS